MAGTRQGAAAPRLGAKEGQIQTDAGEQMKSNFIYTKNNVEDELKGKYQAIDRIYTPLSTVKKAHLHVP